MSACGNCGAAHARLSDEWFCGVEPLSPEEARALGLLAAAEDLLSGTAGAIERRELPQLTTRGNL